MQILRQQNFTSTVARNIPVNLFLSKEALQELRPRLKRLENRMLSTFPIASCRRRKCFFTQKNLLPLEGKHKSF